MLQAFCVPVAQIDDADASSHRLKRGRSHQREPVEGWAMWTSGIIDIIESCATQEALERLQERQRPLLKAVSREKPDLYAQLGAAFAKRTAELNGKLCAASGEQLNGEARATPEKVIVRSEPSTPGRGHHGKKRAKTAARENGEACAKRRRGRSTEPARETSTKRTTDAQATEPA